jgi:hypothetical protein
MHHFGNKEQGARPTQLTNVQCAGLSPRSLFKSEIGFFLDNVQKHQRPIAHPPGFFSLPRPDAKVHDTLCMDSRGIQERNPEFVFIE